MAPCFGEVYGNASSIHHFGQMAKERLESARRQTAAMLHCRPQDIVFTSGGTEADNLALLGSVRPCEGKHVITTAIEHPREPRLVPARPGSFHSQWWASRGRLSTSP